MLLGMFFVLNARGIVNIPILPIYIINDSTSFDCQQSVEVIPKDNPTVQIAEKHS